MLDAFNGESSRATLVGERAGAGDDVLVKAFRGVGLKGVADALAVADEAASPAPRGALEAARG
jgi:hypothetical protein